MKCMLNVSRWGKTINNKCTLLAKTWSEQLCMFVYLSPVSMTTSYQLKKNFTKEIQDLIFMSVEFNKVLSNYK